MGDSGREGRDGVGGWEGRRKGARERERGGGGGGSRGGGGGGGTDGDTVETKTEAGVES